MTKTCTICNTDKELDELVVAYAKEDGSKIYRSICKKCANKKREDYRKKGESEAREQSDKNRQKAYRENNREAIQWRTLQWKYGISKEQYLEMLETQGGGCAICGSKDNLGRKLAVDHHHDSGKVRGLLCSHCNTAIGLLREDPKLFSQATSYLLKHLED